MRISQWYRELKDFPHYILTRCVFLSCAMLLSAVVVLSFAGGHTLRNDLLHEYASYTTTMALVVLAAGPIGAALLQDILVKRGQ